MNKYFERSIESAALHGLEPGEYVLTTTDGRRNLIVALPRSERKDTTVSFTAFVLDAVKYNEHDLIETGFYPVRYNGRTRFGFYHKNKEVIYIIASAYSHHVRYGALLDLDRSRFETQVLKHLNHAAAENRKLQKEITELREELATAKASEKKPSGGLKYEAPQSKSLADIFGKKEDDDDDLY